jgi:hypothetical protein
LISVPRGAQRADAWLWKALPKKSRAAKVRTRAVTCAASSYADRLRPTRSARL